MTLSYFVETAAEADRAVKHLATSTYEASAQPTTTGFVVTVAAGPSVSIEELLLRAAPSARRL